MAKIALRAYHREIESLIERGQNQEAITHCKYILKVFPKSIDTYRLLGKAYLENQRYGEAADILQRILSVTPDDFVSHIGNSIIKEDEGNLDAAIYHMERAFEVQPSNPAIQEELRRLYGRRDGVMPPRVRLTRGALVRMYARGELYRQAIAEANAALSEDPKRVDLEVILAQVYHKSGLKVEATELCGKLVSKLPYCQVANQILCEILPGTSRAEDAKLYAQRLYALDPYLAYTSENAQTSDLIPDQAVTLDRMDYRPETGTTENPEWARSIGVQIDKETHSPETPDWLDAIHPQSDQFQQETTDQAIVSTQISGSESEKAGIPEWMSQAGWGEATHAAEETEISFEEELVLPEIESSGEIAPANIPDWLAGSIPQEIPPQIDQPEDQTRLAWLKDILPNPDTDDSTEIGRSPDAEEAIPDWLHETSDQLDTSSGTTDIKTSDNPPQEYGTPSIEGGEESLPDWLSMETKQHQGENGPEATEQELPEWLQLETPDQSQVGVDRAQSGVTGWLNSLQDLDIEIGDLGIANNPAPVAEEEFLVDQDSLPPTDAVRASDLKSEQADFQEEVPEMAPPEAPPVAINQPAQEMEAGKEKQSALEASRDSDLDADAAFAWLESLAARQGATEALILNPEDRSETPPDWVNQAAEDATLRSESLPVGEPINSLNQPGMTNEILAPTQETDKSELELITPSPIEIENNPPMLDQVKPEVEDTTSSSGDADAAFAWLESLAARQGATEALILNPEDRDTTPPEWVVEASQTSEQVNEISTYDQAVSTEDSINDEPPQLPVADLPEDQTDQVLSGNFTEGSPAEQLESNIPQDSIALGELPDWLQDISPTSQELENPQGSREDAWLKEFDISEPLEQVEPTQEVGQLNPQPIPTEESSIIEDLEISELPYELTAHQDLHIEERDNLEKLASARQKISSGNTQAALENYGELIEKGSLLTEIIHDLQDALYRYPVDISLWMTIGDAYAKNNRLQDALEAYSKAEELLR